MTPNILPCGTPKLLSSKFDSLDLAQESDYSGIYLTDACRRINSCAIYRFGLGVIVIVVYLLHLCQFYVQRCPHLMYEDGLVGWLVLWC